MLSFLRTNSLKIVYGIIIAFIITTFFGVVFFNEAFKESSDQQQIQIDMKSAIATIGQLPVKKQTYLLALRRIQQGLPRDQGLTLQQYEQVQLNALNKSIENTLFIEYAKSKKIKVKRDEINVSLYSVMEQFNVSSKRELKSEIRKSGGSYEDLIKQLKEDILANKVRKEVMDSVEISDLDRQNINKKFNIKELYISNYSTSNVKIDEKELVENVSKIRAGIKDSQSLSNEIQAIYDAYGVQKPERDDVWISINQRPKNIMREIYKLTNGQISNPIKTNRGYFIIELIETSENTITNNITEDSLLSTWKSNELYSFLFDIQADREIKIMDPSLRGIKLKYEGQFDAAIEAYQALLSQDPSNPYPNFLISQIYALKGNQSNEKQELLIAEIKESLIGGAIILPQLHLRLAEIYEIEGFNNKRDEQYDKLLNERGNIELLQLLETLFKEKGDSKREQLAKALIKEATATNNVNLEDNPFESAILDNQ